VVKIMVCFDDVLSSTFDECINVFCINAIYKHVYHG